MKPVMMLSRICWIRVYALMRDRHQADKAEVNGLNACRRILLESLKAFADVICLQVFI